MTDREQIQQDTAKPTPAEIAEKLAFGNFINDVISALTPVLQKYKRNADEVDGIFQALFDPDLGLYCTEAADFFANNDDLEDAWRCGDYSYRDNLNRAKRLLRDVE